jgi:peptidoglycan biosynthesis protein MviN/MurJ (putative lipid II flippase)
LGASSAVAVGLSLCATPVIRLVYGAAFIPAAPALLWIGAGLIPSLSNSGRKVFLYASGGEGLVVRWSAVALLVQLCAGAALIPTLGGAGAAIGVALGEAIIWWPLRRATPQNLEHPEHLEHLEHPEHLEHLEHPENLEHPEHPENLQNLFRAPSL